MKTVRSFKLEVGVSVNLNDKAPFVTKLVQYVNVDRDNPRDWRGWHFDASDARGLLIVPPSKQDECLVPWSSVRFVSFHVDPAPTAPAPTPVEKKVK